MSMPPTLGNTIVVRERRTKFVRDVTGFDQTTMEVLNNPIGTSDPTVTDDVTQGYQVGSWWLNAMTNALWYCFSNTAGAASWSQTNPSGAVTNITTDGDGITANPDPIVSAGTLSVQWNAGDVDTIGDGIVLTDGTISATTVSPPVADLLGSNGTDLIAVSVGAGLSNTVSGANILAVGQDGNNVSSGTYTILNTDLTLIKRFTVACAVTLPQAGLGGQFLAKWNTFLVNYTAADNVVVTPSVSTINDQPSLTLGPGDTALIYVTSGDSANYKAELGLVGGDVTASGTPTAGQIAQWVDATTIEGVSFATALAAADLSGLPTSNPGGGKPWLNGGFLFVGAL